MQNRLDGHTLCTTYGDAVTQLVKSLTTAECFALINKTVRADLPEIFLLVNQPKKSHQLQQLQPNSWDKIEPARRVLSEIARHCGLATDAADKAIAMNHGSYYESPHPSDKHLSKQAAAKVLRRDGWSTWQEAEHLSYLCNRLADAMFVFSAKDLPEFPAEHITVGLVMYCRTIHKTLVVCRKSKICSFHGIEEEYNRVTSQVA